MSDWTPPNSEYPPPKAGEPALHRAARVGDHDQIRRLAASGAQLNEVFDIGLDPGAYERHATPLMSAAGSGDGATVGTVRLLLELGADPKQVAGNNSAATFAAEGLGWNYRPGGDAERLRALLAAGSPLPKSPRRANRLLCQTASLGDADRLALLLESGSDARGHWDKEDARQSHLAMTEMLEKHSAAAGGLLASMPESVRAGMAETFKKMHEDEFERYCSAPSPLEIPLFRAAESGSGECVRLLLAAGADPRIRDNSSRTAMYCASSLDAVRALVDAGVPLEDSDQYEWSPLAAAVNDGAVGVARVRALIEAGANVNAAHDRGYTVFMSAVGSGRHPDTLRLLVAGGADPHAVSELGYNAFHAAIDVNGEANDEPAVRETLGYLKTLGVDIEHRNQGGQTPLARALQAGTGIEVRVLCELSADPNAVCPKHQCGGSDCTRIDLPLLFHAADGIGVDKDVKTEALLSAGADPWVQDGEGYRPVSRVIAQLCGNAPDCQAACERFAAGLRRVQLRRDTGPESRDEFVTHASGAFRTFMECFASEIPIPQTCEFDAVWRREQVNCIVLLLAYEAWTHRRRSPGAASPRQTGGFPRHV